MLAIAVTVALMFVGVQNSHAQDLGTLPMPEPNTTPEIVPPQIQLPPVYRVNRDVPCTEFAMVKAILESQNQSPINIIIARDNGKNTLLIISAVFIGLLIFIS